MALRSLLAAGVENSAEAFPAGEELGTHDVGARSMVGRAQPQEWRCINEFPG